MLNDWLLLLCEFLPNISSAAVIRANGKGTMAVWPHQNSDVECFYGPAKQAVKTGAPFYKPATKGSQLLAFPMRRNNLLFGVLCLEAELSQSQLKPLESLIQWAITWLEIQGKSQNQDKNGFEQILNVLDLCARQQNILDSSSLLASTLADAFDAQRVVIAVERNGVYRLVACSHTNNFDVRTESFTALEDYLNIDDEQEQLAALGSIQQRLKASSPAAAVKIYPLNNAQRPAGFVVVHYSLDKPLSSPVDAQIKIIARQLAPLYDQWVARHHSLQWRFKKHLVNSFKGKKALYWGVVGLVLIAACIVKVPHTVKAEGVIEGLIQQAIVAPEDGYLKAAYIQAGELISLGQPLAQLDDRTIRLEVQRLQSEKQEYERLYSRELNELNHVQMRIAKAKIEQAQAQLNLYQQQLARVNITAPMDGVVISGDLSRAIGSPVKKGQVLFEMAPINEFKLVIWVKEKDITYISKSQSGKLLVSAFPQRPIEFDVSSVSSLHDLNKKSIVYRVEAKLEANELDLRPGMSGVAKIHAGKKTPMWLGFYRLYAWLKLKVWAL